MPGLAVLLATAPLRAHGPLHEEILRLTAELEQHPDDPVRLARRGELLQLHGLPDQALVDFERLARLHPSDVTNDFRLGAVHLEMGSADEAVRCLERFDARQPGSIAGHLLLARALVRSGNPQAGVAHFERAIELSAEPAPDWFLEKWRALQASNASVEEQLTCLDAGMARLGPLPVLQLAAVDLEVRRGSIDGALARLDALAARAERKERWMVRRGEILLSAGRTHEARTEFLTARKALDALPDKLRRAWTATELRQQVEAKLAALTPSTEGTPLNTP